VQNCLVPIIVSCEAPGTKKGGLDRWRASWLADYQEWLKPYFLPDGIPIEKCPHGNAKGLDCTVCRPYLVPWDGAKLVPNRQVRIDLLGRPLYFLRLFHRSFDYVIEEHYVSPYDSHFRRSGIAEYEGGYVTAGWGDDGIGIRAKKRHGPDSDEFEFYPSGKPDPSGRNGVYATFPRPDTECEFRFSTPKSEEHKRIDGFRFSTNRATRFTMPVRETFGFIFAGIPTRVPSWVPERKPPEGLTGLPVSARPIPDRTWSVGKWLKAIGVTLPREVPARPSDKELVRRNYGPSVGVKVRIARGWYTIVLPDAGNRAARRHWPEGWRTERKMRDTAAALRMYEYGGDGLINVGRMKATAWRNDLAARKKSNDTKGIVEKQTFWPGDRIPRGSGEARPSDPGNLEHVRSNHRCRKDGLVHRTHDPQPQRVGEVITVRLSIMLGVPTR
jgi:hypothetical protein